MIDRDRIERSAQLFAPPPDALERLVRRHERRRRNQRVTAGVVGIAILLAGLFAGYEALGNAEPAPRDPTPTPTSPPSAVAPVRDIVFLLDLETGAYTSLPRSIQELSPDAVLGSPDGSSVAFEGYRDGSGPQIYVARVDGSDVRAVTDDPDGARLGGWAPDGAGIVYTAGATVEWPSSGGHAIKIVDVASGVVREVFSDPDDYLAYPVFAPDGASILFTRASKLPSTAWQADLWTAPADGGTPTKLIEYGAYGSYSPDGSRIVYRQTDLQPDAYCGQCWWVSAGNVVVPADGSQQLGRSGGGHMSPPIVFDKVQPQWSPDGERFIFFGPSNRTGEFFMVTDGPSNRVSMGEAAFASWLDDHTLVVTDPQGVS